MVLECYPYCGTLPWRRLGREEGHLYKQRIQECKFDCVLNPGRYFSR